MIQRFHNRKEQDLVPEKIQTRLDKMAAVFEKNSSEKDKRQKIRTIENERNSKRQEKKTRSNNDLVVHT